MEYENQNTRPETDWNRQLKSGKRELRYKDRSSNKNSKFVEQLSAMYKSCGKINEGALNNTIPQLSTQDPGLWAVSIAMLRSGQTVDFGPVEDATFSIQSVVKVLLFGYAANQLGLPKLSQHVKCRGVCLPYDSDFLVDGAAPNACLNIGALTASALILQHAHQQGESWRISFDHFKEFIQLLCGRNILCDLETYLSEYNSASANRNILQKLLGESGIDFANINTEEVLKFYTSCCALLVNTKQLADIGVMLAQNGMTRSGVQILEAAVAKCCLAQMMQAGLYEQSGDFFALTGIAAKSGVSGGVVAVAHKKMAIALFSPKLNAHGNSVRGIAFLTALSKTFSSIHLFSEENFPF